MFTFKAAPPRPTDEVQRHRRPLPSMPYKGVPDGGIVQPDGRVSWEDADALDYVRDVRWLG